MNVKLISIVLEHLLFSLSMLQQQSIFSPYFINYKTFCLTKLHAAVLQRAMSMLSNLTKVALSLIKKKN